MTELRPYQQRAVDAILSFPPDEPVLCVAPTGAGKTVIAEGVIRALYVPTLVSVHTEDLLAQTRRRMPFGVHVESVQGLLSRGYGPAASLLLLDEAHHYVSAEWSGLHDAYRSARVVGFTATPQRQDGIALGNIFRHLVVAAQYPELVAAGYLVKERIKRPDAAITDGLALDPVAAYLTHGEGRSGFCYCRTKAEAYEAAEKFSAMGIPAACITDETPKLERARSIEQLGKSIRILTNVYTLTEGVDVPAASIAILARQIGSVSQYLQICGRVLRPADGKTDALILDLVGASHRYGSPTEARTYSLDGEGISSPKAEPVSTCAKCGATYPPAKSCPFCGFVPQVDNKPLRIYNEELREVYAGAFTAEDAKRRELERLLGVCESRGIAVYWAVKEYQKLFGEKPDLSIAPPAVRAAEFDRLVALQRERNFKPGFVAVRYRELFGVWPPRQRQVAA